MRITTIVINGRPYTREELEALLRAQKGSRAA